MIPPITIPNMYVKTISKNSMANFGGREHTIRCKGNVANKSMHKPFYFHDCICYHILSENKCVYSHATSKQNE